MVSFLVAPDEAIKADEANKVCSMYIISIMEENQNENGNEFQNPKNSSRDSTKTNHVDGPSRGSHNRNIGAQHTPLTKWHFGLGTPSWRPGPAEW